MGSKTVEVKCAWNGCGKTFTARVADRKRGWGKFCSKSCKAKKQENSTGQHRQHKLGMKALKKKADLYPDNLTSKELERLGASQWEINEATMDEAMYDSTSSHGQD